MALFSTLRSRLVTSVVFTIFIMGAGAVAAVYFYSSNELRAGYVRDISLATEAESATMSQLFDNVQSLAATVATNSIIVKSLAASSTASTTLALSELEKYNIGGQFQAIYTLNEQGIALESTDPTFVNNDYSFRQYATRALKGQPWSEVAIGITSKKLGYYFSYPVRDPSDRIIGAVVLKMKPEPVDDIMLEHADSDQRFFMLVESEGVVVASNDTSRLFKTLGALSDEAQAALRAEKRISDLPFDSLGYDQIQERIARGQYPSTVRLFDEVDGEEEIVSISAVGQHPFFVVVDARADRIYTAAAAQARILSFFVVVAALLATLVIIVLMNRFLLPLREVQKYSDKVGRGDFTQELNIRGGGSELSSFAIAVNTMSRTIKKSYSEMERTVKERTEQLEEKNQNLSQSQHTMIKVMKDIESEKERSSSLAKDLEKFKLAVEGAFDHIVITDSEGIILFANRAVERITGFSPSEILGKKAGAKDLGGGLMDKSFYERLWRTVKVDKSTFAGKLKNKRKNGEVYDAVASISPILDELGDVRFIIGIERDISEQVLAEEQVHKVLNDLEERSQMVMQEKIMAESLLVSIGDGIIATDQDGKILKVNDSALGLLGMTRGEMENRPLVEVVRMFDSSGKPVPLYKRPAVIALASGKMTTIPPSMTYYYANKNGDKFPVGLAVTPYILNDKIIGTVNVFRDVTMEKNIDRVKTEFVSLASHQLRTPLTTISWYIEMLLNGDVGRVAKAQKKYLETVYKANKSMIELVNALLNVSRIELGTFAVDPVPTDIKELTQSVWEELEPQVLVKKLKVSSVYPKSLGKIPLDPSLIRIVFQNLLTNAMKYTPEGGSILLTIEKQEQGIQVSVKDTGYGIPRKDQPMIFSKMFRADNIKVHDTTGTGLGLYMVKSIIEQSAKGKVWFESEENKGTTFYFTIPHAGMEKKVGSKALT